MRVLPEEVIFGQRIPQNACARKQEAGVSALNFYGPAFAL